MWRLTPFQRGSRQSGKVSFRFAATKALIKPPLGETPRGHAASTTQTSQSEQSHISSTSVTTGSSSFCMTDPVQECLADLNTCCRSGLQAYSRSIMRASHRLPGTADCYSALNLARLASLLLCSDIIPFVTHSSPATAGLSRLPQHLPRTKGSTVQ
jgi:hypothetical protein